jgi:hypothetical protein
MSLNPLLIVGAGTFCGAAGVIAFNVVRARRAARIRARRDQLMGLARRADLEYVGDRARSEDIEAAHWFRGEERQGTVDGFLQGQDRHGRYWVARRKVMGEVQEVLGFQIRGDLNVGRAYIEPSVAGAQEGGTSWARRIFSRSTPGRFSISRWVVHREVTPKQIEDQSAADSIDRWMKELVSRSKNDGRVPMGLEVRSGQAWVFSAGSLEGARMAEFLRCALEMRSAVVREVQKRPATITTRVNTVSGEVDTRNRAETAPLFAVEVSESADLSAESKTVVLSAEDLLREAPAPRRRKKKKFEIPEVDVDVEVIGTWGR